MGHHGGDVRQLMVDGRHHAGPRSSPSCSAQGQEVSESHCKELNRAEPQRTTAAPACSAPPVAEGRICVMLLVLGATGERRPYFDRSQRERAAVSVKTVKLISLKEFL